MMLDRLAIVPVVVIDDPGRAPDLIAALVAGGIRCAEITLRTEAAIPAIRAAAEAATDDFLVAAGTVLSRTDVEDAVHAGARLIVSPGLDDAVVARSAELGVASVPGVATATEVQRAFSVGLERLKFFPAAPMGGLATMEALAAPFPGVRFMPSGGVDASNAAEYAASPAVFAVSGSWMAPRELIAAGDWLEITRRSREAMTAVGAA